MLRKIVESFFSRPALDLHRANRQKSKRRTPNQSGGVFLRVFRERFFTELVAPGETQAPLRGWLAARSGLMPKNDCGCRKAIENQNALWEPPPFHGVSFDPAVMPKRFPVTWTGGSDGSIGDETSCVLDGTLPRVDGSVRRRHQGA